jgi:hypothetical protein
MGIWGRHQEGAFSCRQRSTSTAGVQAASKKGVFLLKSGLKVTFTPVVMRKR